MPNNRFNKQVTPKGYQKGGSVRDTRKTEQMIGASISSKREKGRAKKMGGGMMKRPMMKEGGKLKMVTKNGKKVPFFAADGNGSKDLGKAAGAAAAAAKLGKTTGAGLTGSKLKKLNPGLRSFMQKKMKNK